MVENLRPVGSITVWGTQKSPLLKVNHRALGHTCCARFAPRLLWLELATALETAHRSFDIERDAQLVLRTAVDVSWMTGHTGSN